MKQYSILMDFPYEGDVVKLYIPQPSYERVRECVSLFSYIFTNIQNYPALVLAKDLECVLDDLSAKKPNIKSCFEGLIQEAVLQIEPVSDLDLIKGLEFYNKLTEEQKQLFKAMYVFQYALLRYAPQETIESDLSEYCTALSFMDYKKHFLKSIEEVEKKSSKQKKQEG